ncbi:hypothetical protein [Thermococcus sp.]|uniref:hypothetical protein n=1 Tax=Thermococcus sp. TaxID=35749 RepID=UPI00262C648E|nr:hypothetical protein [Thermococcus sp.]
MGAVEAFTKAFSIIRENKKLYLLALTLALILAPIGAYTLPGKALPKGNVTTTHSGNVIVEEYGSSMGNGNGLLTGLLEKFALYSAITLLLGSIFEYGVVKGALLHIEGQQVRFSELLGKGLKKSPAVITINILYIFIGLAILSVGLIPMGVGIVTLPSGAILVFVGLGLTLLAGTFAVALSLLPVPMYADEENFGAALKAMSMSLRNVLTTVGFGFLVMVAVLGIAAISGPIAFLTTTFLQGKTGEYVSVLLQAPFTALLYEFLWVAGVAFYRELKKKKELKKVDEELAELGIDF